MEQTLIAFGVAILVVLASAAVYHIIEFLMNIHNALMDISYLKQEVDYLKTRVIKLDILAADATAKRRKHART
jgi:hypothetical protein